MGLTDDKPISMSVKDFLIRKLAVKTLTSESVVEAVVNHQFHSLLDAMKSVSSVEVSGFGKFYFNQGRADRKFKKAIDKINYFYIQMNDESLSLAKRNSAINKLNNTIVVLESLKPKVTYECFQYLRGVEEQIVSRFPYEGMH